MLLWAASWPISSARSSIPTIRCRRPPGSSHPPIIYPVAATSTAKPEAKEYLDYLHSSAAKTALEKYGFNYLDWNEAGACTLHYHVADLKKIKNLRDLVPNWCFKFIDWACAKNDGRCSFKIDWFAAKNLKLIKGESSPKVVGNLKYQGRECSDHDAIVVDFQR